MSLPQTFGKKIDFRAFCFFFFNLNKGFEIFSTATVERMKQLDYVVISSISLFFKFTL